MHSLPYFSISSQLLMEEAKKLGIQVDVLAQEKNLFIYSYGGKSVLFKSVNFGENSLVGTKVADDKELTHIILSRLNYPIASSVYVDSDGYSSESLGPLSLPSFPVIIKPLDEAHGAGLMMNITSLEELNQKLQESFKTYSRMIIQKQIFGKEFRVLVCKKSIILAFFRHPPVIFGDGTSTIMDLIKKENSTHPLRGEGYHKPLAFIKADSELQHHIAEQGYGLESILEVEKALELRGNSNVGTGGTIEEITHILHPSIKNMCLHIADFMKLGICGIDIMATDPTLPLAETGGVVLEVNASPGIGGHRELTSVNSAREILVSVFDLEI